MGRITRMMGRYIRYWRDLESDSGFDKQEYWDAEMLLLVRKLERIELQEK